MCVCVYVCSALDHGTTPPGVTLDRPPSFHGPRWTHHPPPMVHTGPATSSHVHTGPTTLLLCPCWTHHPPLVSLLDPPPSSRGPRWTRHPSPMVYTRPAILLPWSTLVCVWDLVFITHTPKTQFQKVQRTDAEAEALILWPPDVKS